MTEINYLPEMGKALPSGNLCIPTAGRAEDGEIWDGQVEISPDNPNYAAWLELAKNRKQYLETSAKQRNDARRQRRGANKLARGSVVRPRD